MHSTPTLPLSVSHTQLVITIIKLPLQNGSFTQRCYPSVYMFFVCLLLVCWLDCVAATLATELAMVAGLAAEQLPPRVLQMFPPPWKTLPPCEICVCCGSLLMAPMNVRHLFESATWILSLLSSLVYFVIIVTLFITVCYPSLLPSSVEVHVLAVSCPCCEIVLWQLVYQSTLVEQSTTSQVSTASRTQPRLSILSQRCIVISHARLASRLWCVYDVPKVNSLYWFKSFYAVW